MKTQPGRVHALPNLQGFVPAPGIVDGSTGAGAGAGDDATGGTEGDEAEEGGTVF